ncbi:hypothetical protein QJS66_07810 [Kocuria rhizophila]|nr:hypothetical protein QJS66_07810 [Kocuria rhizophila]
MTCPGAAPSGGLPHHRRTPPRRRRSRRPGTSSRTATPLLTPVQNLLEVARLRIRARAAGLTDVATQGTSAGSPAELSESRE